MALDHAGRPFGVIADEIERRAALAGGRILAVRAVLQELAEEVRGLGR